MSITTYSGFLYGFDVNESNFYVDFNEGSGEIGAIVEIGSYNLLNFINAVINSMNNAGTLVYSATIDRQLRKVTISSTSNFDLLVTTGSHSAINCFSLLGFTVDQTGSNSYTSNSVAGLFYEPQYKLQGFVPFEHQVEKAESSVNKSASGLVEVVSFGDVQFMDCNITYITNITGQGIIKNNANAVSDTLNFLNYLIEKKPIEFIPDITDVDNYYNCILESSQASSEGTGFELYELYARGLANYYETKTLKFRRI